MSGWLISLILSAIIALLASLMENDKNKNKMTYGIKIFVVSFIVIYFGWMFFVPESEISQEIIQGEPPF